MIASGTAHEYGYKLTDGKGASDIVAINDHQSLVDERDGKGLGDGSKAVIKQDYQIALDGDLDITALKGADAFDATAVQKTAPPFAIWSPR